MVPAVLVAARVIAPLVEHNPTESHALFFGLVLASLWVPYSSSGRRWRVGDYLLALLMAAAAFLFTGVPSTTVDPHPLIVMAAAAVAVCALVLPGISGSFILLTVGLYLPTMEALNNCDLGYIATFALGATIGLSLFVKLLQFLLDRFHHLTLVVMTGLMAGSAGAVAVAGRRPDPARPQPGQPRALHRAGAHRRGRRDHRHRDRTPDQARAAHDASVAPEVRPQTNDTVVQ